MKYFLLTVFFLSTLTQCTSPDRGNVTISGHVKGLKKGVLFLQKVRDSILINIDSVVVDGTPEFTFITNIKEPEIHYLYLDKHDGAPFNDRITFFAEPGIITIETSYNRFENDAQINGGKNQQKYGEYMKMRKRFADRNLRILKEDYEARKQNDEEKLLKNDVAYERLQKQKYLYTVNFAVHNRKLQVAPYIAYNEIYDANLAYLDTIANSLSPRVKRSIYGQRFLNLLETRKRKENISTAD